MTGEGGYLHDAILFSGSQCLGTGMTKKGGYWDDKEIGTGMTRKERWNDIIGATRMTKKGALG
ncbi:hypothetical protein [Wolbachia endosymbiont of Psylliodes chrysocephala]|uniref:hypothetical protein n=1 Tax=Wolbachia endosymbiont of Psylliodes chrysocephala TaxID=2883236 RepID=UPI00209F6E4E|nr:hypothetical protein [Wolbachia endosymbiont of Psylliodes chrysocephala]